MCVSVRKCLKDKVDILLILHIRKPMSFIFIQVPAIYKR